MAEQNSAFVTAAKPQQGGAFFAAPLGTPLPADATTALNTAFVKLGYLSEDGFENPIETESSDMKAFGGDVVLTQQTGYKETYKTKLLQALDPDVLREVFGQENVTQQGGADKPITVRHNSKILPRRVFVFEVLLAGGLIKRIVIPEGQITERGGVVYKDAAAVGYEVTIAAYPSAKVEGDCAREYIAKAGPLPA
jgi:hypothetical protein